ncbi:MAG: hypothetical protein Kow0063_01770 [Anaerolineae bacterium]
MLKKSVTSSLLVVALLSLLLPPSARVVVAAQPPPLDQVIAPLQPAVGDRPPGLTNDVGAMATTIFYPSADAPVREGAPNSTAPNQLYLGAGYDDGYLYGSSGRVRFYLHFNLSSLPADCIITEATLRLYQVGGRDYPGVSRTVSLYRVTGNWSEASVTWNNRPGYAEAVGDIHTTYDFLGWRDVDVTDLVRAWVAGSQTNYGVVAIGPESIEGVFRVFASRESTHAPELHVSYIIVPPPVLDVSPGALSIRSSSSGGPTQSSILISNVTANSLNWMATKLGGATWLSLDKSSGSATPISPDTLGLTIDPTGLAVGAYTEQIQINSDTPQVEGSPQTVTLTLEVLDHLGLVYLPLLLKGGGADNTPQIVALAIGIADYQYLEPPEESGDLPDDPSSGDLFAPIYDLQDFVLYLRNVLDVPDSNIIQLGESKATKSNVVAAFDQLDAKENRNTVVFIYYSGHGGQVPDSNGDESDGYDEFIAMYEVQAVPGGFTGILTDDELEALLANLDSLHVIIILDSCYSGGMVGATATYSSGDLLRRGLGRPAAEGAPFVQEEMMAMTELAGPGRVVLTGGTGGQATWESYSLQNGVFTYFFLEALQDALNDANQNERISAEEAYWFSRDMVDDWVYTNQQAHQNPDISDSHFGQVDLTWLP